MLINLHVFHLPVVSSLICDKYIKILETFDWIKLLIMMSNLIKVGYMFYWLTMFFIITAESVIIYHNKYARTLPCHNLICSRYISTTTSQRTSHGKKITAGEIAQQRLHLHLDGEKKHNSKRESSIKRKGWKRQARTQAGTSLHRSHESEGKMIQGEFHAPEVRRKQAFTSTRYNALQRLITMMYGHISLINEKAEQQQKKDSEQKLFHTTVLLHH